MMMLMMVLMMVLMIMIIVIIMMLKMTMIAGVMLNYALYEWWKPSSSVKY